MRQSPFEVKRNFIIKLGKALHKYGTPAFRLESHLRNVAETLGLNGYFLVTPTSLTFVLWAPDDTQEYNYVMRVKPGEIDLGMLARTNQLVVKVSNEEISLGEAMDALNRWEQYPAVHSPLTMLLAFAVTGGAFAMLMSANWTTILWASLLSIISFYLAYRAEHSKGINEALEPVAALLCSFIAVSIAQLEPQIDIPIVILSSIIIFIPGLSLTLGLSELAARELISGTARVMDGVMVLFKLYFGAVLGMAIGSLVWGQVDLHVVTVSDWWIKWLGVVLLSLGLTIVFKVRRKDMVWGVLSGVIAYAAAFAGSFYLGDALGPFIGAFVVGVYANLFAKLTKSPASVVLLQGIVLLVPGSKAYISLNSMVLGQSMVSIPNIGSQTFLIFMSIVAGILFANVAVPQRSSL
ncbi:threonine/serine exporter family protein [Agarivorans sp. TSD2052]|uniref:threonine/serine ThrE exporter family protein n=1 Tax=Agarivorans sp. TSD2052 TaxID=2937286 RepID=UPI00200BA5F5|nr:threonine/serine exporter family protein [Agarivorans sp. TSD2052]UPW19651.1 threonine/serine exporter family protein [Agarivorans sp. TSD2052]